MTTSIRSETTRSVLSVNGVDKLSLSASGTPIPTGLFKKLTASATGTSATVTIAADEIMVSDGQSIINLSGVSLTPSLASSGINGLDTGTSASSTWYSVWVIHNPTTGAVAGLFSTSETSPTLPSGYTHKTRVGWVRSDSTANKYPLAFVQYGRSVRYAPATGSNITSAPIMASGAAANITAVAVANFVPVTAGGIAGAVVSGAAQAAGASPVNIAASYGAYAFSQAHAGGGMAVAFIFYLTSTNIYWYSSGGSALHCHGWEDNL